MKNPVDSTAITTSPKHKPKGRKHGERVVWTDETVAAMCILISSGKTVIGALSEVFPELRGKDKKLVSKQASFLECVLYGDSGFNLMYRRARRSQAHSSVDRAVDCIDDLIAMDSDDKNLKSKAVATRVATDGLFRAAELWSPEEFGRHNNLGGSLNVQINTSLPAPPDPDQVGGGFHVEIAPAPVPSQLPAAKDEGKRTSDNG